MLGRAATRIELNRDSDMDELEQEKNRRLHELRELQMLNQQTAFGQRVGGPRIQNQSHFGHSIFTNDSSSSGLGNSSMIQMPNFQPHNMGTLDVDDQGQHGQRRTGMGVGYSAHTSGNPQSSLLVFGQVHSSSHTPAARPTQMQRSQQAQGSHTQSNATQQYAGQHPTNFHPPQNPDSGMY